MYRCELTGAVVPANTRCYKIVLETRAREYDERAGANAQRMSGKKKPLFRDDPGGTGWEIAREVKVSPEVFARYTSELQTGASHEAAVQAVLEAYRRR